MVTFVINITIAVVLTAVTFCISWFVMEQGILVIFCIYLAILCFAPLIKMFMKKKKPSIQKVGRSFSDMICSVLDMIAAWANKKHSAMAPEKSAAVPAVSAAPGNGNTVQEIVQEVEEELDKTEDNPDPEEELSGQISFEDDVEGDG